MRPQTPADSKSPRARPRGPGLPGLAIVFAVGIFGIFIAYPVVFTVLGSFWSGEPGYPGHYTLANYAALFGARSTYTAILNTFIQAGSSSLIAVGLGTLLSLITVRTDTPLRKAMYYLPYLPFAFPVLIANQAWIYIFEKHVGLMNIVAGRLGLSTSTFNIYSWPGMVFASAMALTPICYLIVSTAMRSMDTSLEEAARSAGSGVRSVILRISLPLMSPSILSAFLLAFTLSAGSFETPTMIGIPAGITVMMSSVYYNADQIIPPNYPAASTMSVLLLVIIMVMVFFYNRSLRMSRRFEVVSGKGYSSGGVLALGRWRYVALAMIVAYLVLAIGLPAFTITVLSLVPIWLPNSLFSRLSLKNYTFLFSHASGAMSALTNSLITAVTAATIITAVALVVLFASRRTSIRGRGFVEGLAMFPISMPTLVIGFGLLWAFLTIKTGLYGTLGVMVIAIAVALLPQGVRSLSGGVVQVHRDLQEAARASGASFVATIRHIFLPLVRPSLVSTWLYVFIGGLTTLGPILFLGSVHNQLFSALLWSLWSSGNLGATETFAAGCVLLLVILVIAICGMVLAQRAIDRPLQRKLAGEKIGRSPGLDAESPVQRVYAGTDED